MKSSVLCTKAISPGFSRPLNEMLWVLDGRCLGCACLRDEVNTFPVAVLSPLSWQVQQTLICLNPVQEVTRVICFLCFHCEPCLQEPWFSCQCSVTSCICWLAHWITAFVTVAAFRISWSCESHHVTPGHVSPSDFSSVDAGVGGQGNLRLPRKSFSESVSGICPLNQS